MTSADFCRRFCSGTTFVSVVKLQLRLRKKVWDAHSLQAARGRDLAVCVLAGSTRWELSTMTGRRKRLDNISQVTKWALMSGEQVPSGGKGSLSPDEQLVRLTGRNSAGRGQLGGSVTHVIHREVALKSCL